MVCVAARHEPHTFKAELSSQRRVIQSGAHRLHEPDTSPFNTVGGQCPIRSYGPALPHRLHDPFAAFGVGNKFAAFEVKSYKIDKGHYDDSLLNCFSGKKFDGTEGWGYSYGVGWSIHYFFYSKDPKKYITMMNKLKTARAGTDHSDFMAAHWGKSLAKLDAEWDEFVKKLKD